MVETGHRSKHAALLYFRTLKAAFTKAEVWGYIDSNPFKKIMPPKVPKKIPKFFNEQDVEIIVEHTEEVLLKNIIVFAFNSGMRIGEIVNLEWGAVDFDQNVVHVRNTKSFITKSGKERAVPMNNKIKDILMLNNKNPN